MAYDSEQEDLQEEEEGTRGDKNNRSKKHS
jgi:hypothetical protein